LPNDVSDDANTKASVTIANDGTVIPHGSSPHQAMPAWTLRSSARWNASSPSRRSRKVRRKKNGPTSSTSTPSQTITRMKKNYSHLLKICLTVFIFTAVGATARMKSHSAGTHRCGSTKPIPVSLEGFQRRGRGRFEIRPFTSRASALSSGCAQYQNQRHQCGQRSRPRRGSFRQEPILSRSYTARRCGGRRTRSLTTSCRPSRIRTASRRPQIAFKAQSSTGNGEILRDRCFDGFKQASSTHDDTIVPAGMGAGPAGDLLHIV